MTKQIKISLATTNDAPDIARLNLLFNEGHKSAEAIASDMANPACVESVILAKTSDQTIGFALIRIVRTVLYMTPHAELTELYVMEEFRQQGVASDLIAFAEKIAKQKGAKSILIQTGDDNIPALSLYHKHGYEEYDVVLKKDLK
ncbi:MAG: GNAT family N-acetyltransferase [Anaerolineales bacterium]|nr:GNAT family N-acetyltransferase [Anaerolineales bacterium]